MNTLQNKQVADVLKNLHEKATADHHKSAAQSLMSFAFPHLLKMVLSGVASHKKQLKAICIKN